MKLVRTLLTPLLGLWLCVHAATAAQPPATDRKVVVGYQTDALPFQVGIANGDYVKSSGYHIDFRRFNSGADVMTAMASGDVQVGYVGSSPLAAAASHGLDVKAFYMTSVSGIDEALVVRNGSGIRTVADLLGKKLAAAPVSTDHYQLLALIKHQGLSEKQVQVFAMPQPEIVAAYNRGDIDGGFVWDPALTALKANGKVLVTSKDVADMGAPTFSAWVTTGTFAQQHPAFLKAFAAVTEKYAQSFLTQKSAWTATSDNAKLLAKFLGGTAVNQAAALQNLSLLPSYSAQSSVAWLGGGQASGVAQILKSTSAFLRDNKKISQVLPSYAACVTPDFVK